MFGELVVFCRTVSDPPPFSASELHRQRVYNTVSGIRQFQIGCNGSVSIPTGGQLQGGFIPGNHPFCSLCHMFVLCMQGTLQGGEPPASPAVSRAEDPWAPLAGRGFRDSTKGVSVICRHLCGLYLIPASTELFSAPCSLEEPGALSPASATESVSSTPWPSLTHPSVTPSGIIKK